MFSRTFFALTALAVMALPVTAGDPTTIEPGDTVTFDEPDGEPEFFTELFFGATCATASGLPGDFSGSYLAGTLPLARGNCELSQGNVFTLEQGPIADSVIMAHINGDVEANGFLSLIGLGQVEANVVVKLIDLGEDEASEGDDEVIAERTISSHEIINEFGLGVELGGDIQAGSATAGQAGLSVAVGADVPICMEVIRDSLRFDITVPLRRGHTYKLQVSGESALKLGLGGGVAIASFHSAFNVPDNPFNPANWFSSSNLPIKNWGLPDLPLPFSSLFTFPELSLGKVTIIPATSIPMLIPFPTSNQLLSALGIPTTLQQLIDHPWVDLDLDLGPEEEILSAGVRITNMTVSLARDALEEDLLYRIEENLARRNTNEAHYRFQLPMEHGGYLEIARSIAQDAIDAMIAAGETVNKAEKQMERGDHFVGLEEWKVAYKHFRKAYRKATQRG